MGFGTSGDDGTTGLGDLIAGMGSATPAPLFYIDGGGRTHALNALADELPEDHPAAEAFLSPVAGSRGRAGHVVAYVDPERAGASGDVVAAMVALTAEVVGRGMRESCATDVRGEAATGPPLSPREAALELGLAALADLTDVDAVADAVAATAASCAGATCAAVFVRRDGKVLEPAAVRGLAAGMLRRVQQGRGLLGWACERGPTVVTSLHRLPPGAPRDKGRLGPLATWLTAPFALLPLGSGTRVVGLLCVSGWDPREGTDAVRVAGPRLIRLAERAGAALSGALMLRQARRDERVQRELEIARQIQRRLLPGRHPAEFPGLQLAGECRAAAQVGGDWYGFQPAGESMLVASLFDVAGHGIGAAFCMTLVRSALRAELARGGTPAEVLGRANGLVAEDLAESGLFATAFVARFDRATGRVEHASAGHARPIHWSAGERAFVTHDASGLPLGLFGDSRYPSSSAPFGEGDLLVLYTDGIVEACDAAGEPFGRGRLMAMVHRLRRRPAGVILKAAWRELARHAGSRRLRDDATLVVVRGARGFGVGEESPRPQPRRLARAADADAAGGGEAAGVAEVAPTGRT